MTPPWLSGAASAFDLFGLSLPQYEISTRPEESDRLALAADWAAVGDDIREAAKVVLADHQDAAPVAGELP